MNLDVTPVGVRAGEHADDGPVSVAPSGHDPFGSRPTVRRRGWVRIVLGALLVIAGVAAAIAGIVDAVGTHDRLSADAVATGTVTEEAPGSAVRFTVPPGERRSYSVYVQFDGLEENSTVQELAVRDTGCTATMPDGVQTSFRGARQGAATTLGSTSSVGHFSSQPGAVEVRCAYTSGTLRSARRRPDALPYLVTPGKPSAAGRGALMIVGGVFAALGGGFLIGWGWRRRGPVR